MRKCTKPDCDCIEIAERENGGPVKNYPCLGLGASPLPSPSNKGGEEEGKEMVWPFNGYAPGNYMNTCSACKKEMRNVDKLCFVCLECAIKSSKETKQQKRIHAKPSLYAYYFESLKEIAIRYGYNLVLHGSMARDLDLIAIPWAKELGDVELMMKEFADCIGGYIMDQTEEQKNCFPHGRQSYVVNVNRELREPECKDPMYYIDISLIPPNEESLIRFAEKFIRLNYYGWKADGMKANPKDVPIEDVFVLRDEVLEILSSVPNVQVSDTTESAQGTDAGIKTSPSEEDGKKIENTNDLDNCALRCLSNKKEEQVREDWKRRFNEWYYSLNDFPSSDQVCDHVERYVLNSQFKELTELREENERVKKEIQSAMNEWLDVISTLKAENESLKLQLQEHQNKSI